MTVLIIAEAGVNHNGDIDMALRLVEAAHAAGADLVKFQTFKTDAVVTANAKKADYQARNVEGSDSQVDMLRGLELSYADHDRIIAHCEAVGIGFFSTAFDPDSLDYIAGLGLEQFKIPSGEITNLPYLRKIAGYGRDVILSTGMATLGDIEAAIEAIEAAGLPRSRITVLHCTTEYPAPMEEVNLRAMNAIGEAFDVAVGYSDHTQGIEIALAAVARGASVIEKHFTLDNSLPGPDHKASLEPHELKAMVDGIRNIEIALGSSVKRPTASERANRPIARRSVVAARAIAAGEMFTADMLRVKRPGTGLSPMLWDSIVGSAARRDFAADEEIEL